MIPAAGRRPGHDAAGRPLPTAAGAPVLVAIDMSENSRAPLLWACEYAAKADLPVTVLHVVHDPADAPGRYRGDPGSAPRPSSEVAEEMLAEFLAEIQADQGSIRRNSRSVPISPGTSADSPGVSWRDAAERATLRARAVLTSNGDCGYIVHGACCCQPPFG